MKKTAIFCILPALLLACGKMETAPAPVLGLRLCVDGDFSTRATVPDEPLLNERCLDGGADVLISGHGVEVNYHIGSPVAGEVSYIGSRWKEDGIVPGQEYDVYVKANPGSETDTDIYRLYDPYAPSYDLSRTPHKLFLMDGSTKWTPTDALEQTIGVTLSRMAAKIELSFSLSSDMAGYSFYGTPQWKIMNYSTGAGLATTPYMMDVSSLSERGGGIITYSYPRSWADADSATVLILNIPLTDSLGNLTLKNYYAMPVVDMGGPGPFALERNTLYRVQAEISTPGSSGEDSSELPANLLYSVLPWQYEAVTDDIDVYGRELDYLMVDPVEDEIREKVLAEGFSPKTRQLNFWSSGPVQCSVPEVYYYNKYGVRVDASTLSPVSVSVSGTKSGTVDVTTTALSNNSVKYIKFRLSLASNPSLFEDIIIRHYPLDYIQNVEGLWSSLSSSGWVDWVADQTGHSTRKTVNNSIFSAKVWYGSSIYYIQEAYRYGLYYASRGSSISNLSNNRMYVIQITSTSDSYTVGRGEHFVSPAFLIASQLGATRTTTSASTASSHCAAYMEVTADGRAFRSWRLPTREEIGIIMGYQYSSDTIDEVLAGDYYWTMEGSAVSKTHYSDPSYDGTSGYIRCVRDLSEEELAIINAND